jgi:hypothetical protein
MRDMRGSKTPEVAEVGLLEIALREENMPIFPK